MEKPVQSALSQYTEPGTRKSSGKSVVFLSSGQDFADRRRSRRPGMPGLPQAGEPSTGPPASLMTCVPVFL